MGDTMGLRAYIIRRLLLVIPTLIGVTILIFAVIQLFTPTQRAMLYVTDPKQASNIQELILLYNLDAPVHIQYFTWIRTVLTGNLGYSHTAKTTVTNAIMARFPATVELVIFSIPITVLLGIYLGVKSATNRDKLVDHVTRSVSIIGWSLPSFWLAIILLAIFFIGLGIFPPERLSTGTALYVRSAPFVRYTGLNTVDGLLNGQLWVTWEALQHLVLPTITLVTIQIALIVRVMRSSMLEALNKGYITAARAKGLTHKEVVNKHARRNALIPVITLSGLLTAGMLNGVIITETVFNINGIGRFGSRAALQFDIPAVLGFSLFSGILFVVANLIVDIAYAYIDPRIRLE